MNNAQIRWMMKVGECRLNLRRIVEELENNRNYKRLCKEDEFFEFLNDKLYQITEDLELKDNSKCEYCLNDELLFEDGNS